jgi:hypothetical protein
MSDIDHLAELFEKTIKISTDLDYQQYFDMARKFMNKSVHEAHVFANRAIKEQEKDDRELLLRLKREHNIQTAMRRFKTEFELFLANKKKVSSCKMNEDCSQEKRELGQLLDKMLNLSL